MSGLSDRFVYAISTSAPCLCGQCLSVLSVHHQQQQCSLSVFVCTPVQAVCVVTACLCCLWSMSVCVVNACLYTCLSVLSVWPIRVCVVCTPAAACLCGLCLSVHQHQQQHQHQQCSLSVWSVTKCGSHSGASAHSSPTADKSHIIQTCNSSSFINQISDKANTSKGKSNQVPDGKR